MQTLNPTWAWLEPPPVEHVFIHGPVWVAKVCREGLAVVLKNQIATNNLHARPSILATKQHFQATGHRIAYTTCPRASIVQQPSRIYPKPEVPSLPWRPPGLVWHPKKEYRHLRKNRSLTNLGQSMLGPSIRQEPVLPWPPSTREGGFHDSLWSLPHDRVF